MNAILGYAQLLEARVIDADELKFVDIHPEIRLCLADHHR